MLIAVLLSNRHVVDLLFIWLKKLDSGKLENLVLSGFCSDCIAQAKIIFI